MLVPIWNFTVKYYSAWFKSEDAGTAAALPNNAVLSKLSGFFAGLPMQQVPSR
jgi:hypothetical protein